MRLMLSEVQYKDKVAKDNEGIRAVLGFREKGTLIEPRPQDWIEVIANQCTLAGVFHYLKKNPLLCNIQPLNGHPIGNPRKRAFQANPTVHSQGKTKLPRLHS